MWDGNRQLQEQNDTHIFTTIYEQDSFEPVARLVWLQDDLLKSANDEIIKAERESWEPKPTLIPNVQIYHYHNDHLGTPNELTSQDGEVVWLADYEAWGNTAKVVWREEKLGQSKVSAEELQPIRFQGQTFDVETGLHYNRFRYFDTDLGMFISRDPIGLMGGVNTFQYASNPTGWIDPFGLSGCSFRSLVKSDTLLLNEAKKLSQAQSKGINDLMEQISKGNTNPGIGTKVFDGMTEFRHRSGGRLYARKNGDGWDILGYSNKDNQTKVIARIKKKLKEGSYDC